MCAQQKKDYNNNVNSLCYLCLSLVSVNTYKSDDYSYDLFRIIINHKN